jgi:hypothetical protein
LLLLARRHRRHDVAVEVEVAALVAAHEQQQFFDVAGADVDHDIGRGLQEFLQFGELSAAHGFALSVVGIDAFHRDDLAAGNARRQQVAGDGGFADVAGEVDDGEFHGISWDLSSGLLVWVLKKASATSRPRMPPGKS